MSEIIKHDATIKEIGSETIKVTINSNASCASCKLKGTCSTGKLQEKTIIVEKPKEMIGLDKYEIGEQVNVVMYESQGVKALVLGYILPFVVLMIVLIVTYSFTHNEPLSGLLALASLGPYYFVLYLFRNKLEKQFNLKLES